jgi:hypothetical protein
VAHESGVATIKLMSEAPPVLTRRSNREVLYSQKKLTFSVMPATEFLPKGLPLVVLGQSICRFRAWKRLQVVGPVKRVLPEILSL